MCGKKFLHKPKHTLFDNMPNTTNFLRATIAALNEKNFGRRC